MNRRQYIELLGSTGLIGALGGCGSGQRATETTEGSGPDPDQPRTNTEPPTETPTAPVRRHGIEFETVLNAVDDLGMDPTGSEPIDDVLDEVYGPSTLVVFPPGSYLARAQHEWDLSVADFGLLGLGSDHTEVEFVFPAGNEGAPDPANYWFLRVTSGRNHLVENLTIQQTRDAVTGVGLVLHLEDGLRIHDVELAGFNPSWHHDPGFGLLLAVTERDGVGVVDRFTCSGGGVVEEYPRRKTPVGAFRPHRGELRFRRPYIAESGSHSLYVSRTRGCVRVEDGLFVNNDNTNLRLSGGGHPTKRSWAKDCHIVVDTDRARRLPAGESYQGARGVWVESGGKYEYGHSDLLLEGISVVTYSNAHPLPQLLVEHSHGSTTVRDATFLVTEPRVAPIDARFPKGFVTGATGLTLESVDVLTYVPSTTTGYAVAVKRRPRSALRDVSVTLRSGTVDGILLRDSGQSAVTDSVVRTVDSLAELTRAGGPLAFDEATDQLFRTLSEEVARSVETFYESDPTWRPSVVGVDARLVGQGAETAASSLVRPTGDTGEKGPPTEPERRGVNAVVVVNSPRLDLRGNRLSVSGTPVLYDGEADVDGSGAETETPEG